MYKSYAPSEWHDTTYQKIYNIHYQLFPIDCIGVENGHGHYSHLSSTII